MGRDTSALRAELRRVREILEILRREQGNLAKEIPLIETTTKNIKNYQMDAGNAWKGEKELEAERIQSELVESLNTYIEQCNQLQSDISSAIQRALNKIQRIEDEIAAAEAEDDDED
ncbi:hypothetical protein [Anaerosacchariphilus polymeriproducens]|uniref:DUF5082 domain-containing protein n=1 Tax=Anaerosacchariphilus polymeriproducens TaxID=1812858 RepID=A0A371AR31_9FIRM|nr:hypothetical protein [Anaerosacchariphilus polymeriproducens]RDU22018.1 hypothetical protein DWV06_15915 [Anaerosacchariphilus polymeriproducens]